MTSDPGRQPPAPTTAIPSGLEWAAISALWAEIRRRVPAAVLVVQGEDPKQPGQVTHHYHGDMPARVGLAQITNAVLLSQATREVGGAREGKREP